MQNILEVDGQQYCVSENKMMDVNIITRLLPNEDGLYVMHEYVDFVQGCSMSVREMKQLIRRLTR